MTKEEWLENFSGRLRLTMNNRLMTEADLARASGVWPTNLNGYTHQMNVPSAIVIANFAQVLDVSTDLLINFGDLVVNVRQKTPDIYESVRKLESAQSALREGGLSN